MNVQFIGNSDQQILTTYHAPQNSGRSMGVLIAPPIGTEYLRTHWALRRLAQQLTRSGFPVMRLDYRGVGDSALEFSEIESLSDWHEDLRDAAWSLRDQSGCEEVTIVGLRLGVAIAIGAASGADGMEGLSQIIGWQPVLDGKDYLQSQRSMQACMLDLWPTPINAVSNRTHEEILGALYSRELIGEIESIDFKRDPEAGLPNGVRYVDLEDTELNCEQVPASTEHPAWDDLRYLEIAWLPTQEPRKIVKLIQSPAMEAR